MYQQNLTKCFRSTNLMAPSNSPARSLSDGSSTHSQCRVAFRLFQLSYLQTTNCTGHFCHQTT
ncbi:hypothetical protein RchiOBHm_Chr7g0199411 [Rosa chinensis]|uniref:Uncharacterized protein n=1 Tax=Rosa chinensis TaxID=74649 RepID=A0A2P6P7E9_ROSCH|nr:hypothetical protein RchiOBHm_Chr7g0199411 [Rosa chinensis]